ncbi:MAG: LysM peptidoglycan-binding domain-containing protein, partial [Bacteroidales bacterium]|nr:LysM peptidoglycan-binding domain-containing protein [Bacteroidales bacterium]
ATSDAEKAADEAYRQLVANTEDRFELIRYYISNAYEKGAISAHEALARINKEINSLTATYESLSSRGQNTLSDTEKAVMQHYESLISMQTEYTGIIQKTYDDAVSNVESLQDRVVTALRRQVEAQRDAAIAAIEKERDARLKAFDERIEQLNAEKKALQSTEEQEKKNLKELERKLELSKLDETVFGTKRTAELQKEVDDLRRELAIAAIDKEIEKVTERKETEQESYNTRIANAQNFYAKQLEDAQVYANANKLIMSQNMTEIVNLLKAYDPQFAGIGQMLGSSMGSEIKKQVQAAMASIQTIKVGTASVATSYKPSSPSVAAPVVSTPTYTAPTVSRPPATTPAAPAQRTYTIKKGDTYWGIAGRLLGNSLRYKELENLNPTKPARNLRVGDTIKVPAFNTGGIPVMSMSNPSGSGIAVVEDKERILTERQTNAFDYMVYDILPKMTNSFERLGGSGGTTYNGELVKIVQEIYNNTPFDINNSNDNLSRMMRNELQKLGI